MGLVPLIFGLFSMALLAVWMLLVCQVIPVPWRVNLPPLAVALLLAVGVLGLLLAAIPVLIGVALFLPGHSEITLTKNTLSARETAGPLSWTFRRKRSAITLIEIARRSTAQPASASPSPTALLVTTTAKQRRMLLAPGYPPALLVPLCAELCLQCGLPDPLSTSEPAPESPISPTAAPPP